MAQYAVEMGRLWSDLSSTLSRLDRLAGEPDRLDEERVDGALRRLQYSLHVAAEQAYGVQPPEHQATAHAELADALACARDATAEVADAVASWGSSGVQPFLHEWRGALFRVRLARLRLATPQAVRAGPEPPEDEAIARPLAAFLLALLGALAFVAGATLGVWPLWAAGLLAVGASVAVYRP